MRTIAALLTSLVFASTALADRPHWHHHGPNKVVVDVYTPGYRAPPRPGFVWVDGFYDSYGVWNPGYHQPVAARVGQVWVPGYWSYGQYMPGYWRPVQRAGYVWSPGYYDGRAHVAGGWIHRNAARRTVVARRDVRPAPRVRSAPARPTPVRAASPRQSPRTTAARPSNTRRGTR